jgi:hypothetical protein
MDTGLELVRGLHLEMLDTLVLLFVVFVVDLIVLPVRLHRRRLWVLMLVLELGMRLGGGLAHLLMLLGG